MKSILVFSLLFATTTFASEKEKVAERKPAAKASQLSGDVEYYSQVLGNTGNAFILVQVIDNTNRIVCYGRANGESLSCQPMNR